MKKKKRPDNSSSPRGGYRENAGRKSGWNHKDTCTIRIPKEFASQLVEIARRLDQGEKIDNDTEFINREKDLVTKSKLVGTNGDGVERPQSDREFVHQSESQFDIDTKSKSLVDDTVTESMSSSGQSLTQLQKQQELSAEFENDTESRLPNFDIVTESSLLEISQTTHDFFPGLAFALKNAKTILTAKKSARESIARLLSKLYSTQVKADDL
ncbi:MULTISPECIES: hypothetical protein [unclassified Tolypothrix]|uniref:hypothetical protein n=1 Tax=unclassified Tolypothrix TaxID=2649714 RepID=UPI0005EABB12|nr:MULTISPECIES: hypothetical protein [unclassified Tolypothrix]BAY89801.1 hypothetical protein NIES3275_18040 [Microchaete diplosiphon NIES-3275]EKF00767.1 hypothetical protein FDUTEX481_08579 [Tolypothrix sp. PCC 7601]MBE9082932.1 hypothetical protein [Tolypothrix sp. LEGE 11397]UYD24056.1 hypothetical protein HGR01_21440 [Tolypothrix sp. PCC 7712]UYD33714.1 hypothetical protein HG267_33290 [Tolypothrix sp. PCC 7601]